LSFLAISELASIGGVMGISTTGPHQLHGTLLSRLGGAARTTVVWDTVEDRGTSDHTAVMSISIRDAELSDMEGLQGVFERASLSNENDLGPLLEHPEWLVQSDDGVKEGRMRVAVGEGDAVVGFATYLISNGVAELEDLFVDPPWMRHGIGEALVLDLSSRLKELGFEALAVTANPHAMAFYQHLGFVESETVDTQFYPAPRMWRPIV
jgi:GNAT superfamily N-acetyltransferase